MIHDELRDQALALLDGAGARMPFEEAVAGFPAAAINAHPPNVPYTPWQLLEHLRIAQRDILEYVRSRDYVAPDWPAGYWPAPDATATAEELATTVDSFLADRAALRAIVLDPATDLLAVIPKTPGHTLLREVRILADHNSYHIGEFAILRQIMGTWPSNRRE